MSTVPTVRAPRRCSQCRQERCNKGKATCPVNVERTGIVPVVVPVVVRPVKKRLCSACRREGCCATSILCPVKIEINLHSQRATRLENYAANSESHYEETIFNHIQDPIYRLSLSSGLYHRIRMIYSDQLFMVMMTVMEERMRSAVYSQDNQQRSKVQLTVLPEYKMCTEECGICYDKTCNITLNCNHQVCVDCFKGHVTATETQFNASLKCPFCRTVTASVNATDATIHEALVKL